MEAHIDFRRMDKKAAKKKSYKQVYSSKHVRHQEKIVKTQHPTSRQSKIK